MPENEQNPPTPRPPILAREEAARRAALLSDLSSALEAQGISTALARTHRLVLGRKPHKKHEPSGPTDPQLHIFTLDGTHVVTTDGMNYLCGDGRASADDPACAARQFAAAGLRERPAPTAAPAASHSCPAGSTA